MLPRRLLSEGDGDTGRAQCDETAPPIWSAGMAKKCDDLMRRLFAVLISLASLGSPSSVEAQGVQRIAAIVNDDVISVYDLVSRIEMVIASSNLGDTPAIRRRLSPQVLRNLVDERLKLQEAKRRNISVGKRDIDRAIGIIERQNKIPRGQFDAFLKKNGVRRTTIINQIRASIAWAKLIGTLHTTCMPSRLRNRSDFTRKVTKTSPA